MLRYILFTTAAFFILHTAPAQIVINEASNRNGTIIPDEDYDFEDWIELYNAGTDVIDLHNYALSDDSTLLNKWLFPSVTLAPENYMLIFASGKDRKPTATIDHWELPVTENTIWNYALPPAAIDAWNTNGFDDSGWATGKASIGYGDDDDSTVVPDGTRCIYMRTAFVVSDTSAMGYARFFMDYDDGFIAYLNGNMIAQYGFDDGTADFDETSGADHEAGMYQGYGPEQFVVDEATLKSYIIEGENILAVEVHNVSPGSSDLTARPFIAMGVETPTIFWGTYMPYWFGSAASYDNLHTNFKISGAGEKIFLSDAAGALIDQLYINDLEPDFSLGRKTDGSDIIEIFTAPTPNSTNNTAVSYTGYTVSPAFTTPAGFYSGAQTITITTPPEDVTVYYTLNGQTPAETDNVYTGAFIINATTVVKARCFDNTGVLLPGKTITNTYFIDEDISTPVISITTDDENLYGSEGIYDNWWTDWKRPCYIEYFDSLHVNVLEQNSGIKIDGGAGGSRSLDQKSFRIEPGNSVYGDGTLVYPLISILWYVTKYDDFYLRNGSNMSNVLPYKDAFMTRTSDGTLNEHMAYAPVIVFLNGEYWGYYELRDKLDEQHFEHAHLVNKDSLDLLSVSYWYGSTLRTLSGSDSDWWNMRSYLTTYPTPEDPDFFDTAYQYLDLYQFADYLIAETYMGNTDWPYNNIKIWRDRGGDNKWKYALTDVEWGLGYNGWTNAYSDMISFLFYYNDFIEPFYSLKFNERFRNYFIDRYADLMNTTFLPERTLSMEDSIYTEAIPELPRQWYRWWTTDTSTARDVFDVYREGIRNDFNLRTEQVRDHIQSNFELEGQVEITLNVSPPGAGRIKISTLTIYDMPWQGTYFDGVPVQITAEANTGYTFDHWDASDFISDVLNPSFNENISETAVFTAYFSGAMANEEIAISEINYNSEASVDAGDWFELYNYGEAAVNISGWKIKDSDPLHTYTIPEGITIEPEERYVFVSDTVLFQMQNPAVENFSGPLGFHLSNDTETIYLYNDRNELKNSVTYSDTLNWPQGADGEGRTLELLDASADLNNAANWFDGCIGGSPGEAYTACNDAVIISEINYHSIDTADSEDWIELRNISAVAVDISGWKFMDDTSGAEHEYSIPAATILAPHSNYVLAQNDYTFHLIYPDVLNYSGPAVFDLDNGGEWIRLYDATGKLRNSIHYNDTLPWHTEADGDGYTLELIDSLGLMNDGANWNIICPQGSPGAYASLPCYTIDTTDNISQIISDDYITLNPNPANDISVLMITTAESSHAIIELKDIQGKLLYAIYSGQLQEGSNSFTINTKALSAGIYFVHIVTDMNESSVRLVKE